MERSGTAYRDRTRPIRAVISTTPARAKPNGASRRSDGSTFAACLVARAEVEARIGRLLGAAPADVGIAGHHVELVDALYRCLIQTIEGAEVAGEQRSADRLQVVVLELLQLCLVLGPGDGQVAEQRPRAPEVEGGEVPVAAVGGMPEVAVVAADDDHDVAGPGKQRRDLLEGNFAVLGLDLAILLTHPRQRSYVDYRDQTPDTDDQANGKALGRFAG